MSLSTAPQLCGPSTQPCTGNTNFYTVGTSNNFINSTISYPAVYGNFYWGGKTQILFTAAELNALGVSGGSINEIGFEVAQVNSPSAYNNFQISMGCTNANQITTMQTGLTQVYGPQSVNINTGWNNYTLTQPYDWDGVSNLVVEVCFNNSSFGDTSTNS